MSVRNGETFNYQTDARCVENFPLMESNFFTSSQQIGVGVVVQIPEVIDFDFGHNEGMAGINWVDV